MRISLYLDRRTVLHRLHPLVKLGILAATFASAYGIDRPLAVAPVAIGLGALLMAAGATVNVRRFRVMFVAVPVASFVMWTLFYNYGQGAVDTAASPRAEAVEYAAGMALKLESFLAASVLFLS